jgi:hypothetical protein
MNARKINGEKWDSRIESLMDEIDTLEGKARLEKIRSLNNMIVLDEMGYIIKVYSYPAPVELPTMEMEKKEKKHSIPWRPVLGN